MHWGLTADAQVLGACLEEEKNYISSGGFAVSEEIELLARSPDALFFASASLLALLRLRFSICVSLPALLCLHFFISSTGLHFSSQHCGEADPPSRHTLSLSPYILLILYLVN